MQVNVTPLRAQHVTDAAYTLLGTARDLPGQVDALADALHRQECDCGGAPDEDTVIRASGLVQAGWRRSGDLGLHLWRLLAEIAETWQAAGSELATERRWAPVCVLAAHIAQKIEITR